MQKAVFLALTLATVALAGCADEPASGSFQATSHAVDYSAAAVTISVQPASNSYPAGDEQACEGDDVGNQDPTGVFPFQCQGAQSTVAMTPENGTTFSLAAEGVGYTLFLIDAQSGEFELGALEHHGNGHYAFPEQTYENRDFSSATEVQLRHGDTVVATAPGSGGNFELSQDIIAISAGVNYEGSTINVAVDGVPNNTALTVWLVDIPEEEDEDGNMVAGEPVHAVQFPVSGDLTMYTLTEEEGVVGDYEEFHIHISGSSINVVKAGFMHSSDA